MMDAIHVAYATAVLASDTAHDCSQAADEGQMSRADAQRAHRTAETAMHGLLLEVTQALWRHRREADRLEPEELTPVA